METCSAVLPLVRGIQLLLADSLHKGLIILNFDISFEQTIEWLVIWNALTIIWHDCNVKLAYHNNMTNSYNKMDANLKLA